MLSVCSRLTSQGGTQRFPVRIYLSNSSGYYLDMSMYKEVNDDQTGQVTFVSFGDKQGPLHGLALSTPYVTKDHLQLKRYQAQKLGTTYCYDFPEMFRQVRVYPRG